MRGKLTYRLQDCNLHQNKEKMISKFYKQLAFAALLATVATTAMAQTGAPV